MSLPGHDRLHHLTSQSPRAIFDEVCLSLAALTTPIAALNKGATSVWQCSDRMEFRSAHSMRHQGATMNATAR